MSWMPCSSGIPNGKAQDSSWMRWARRVWLCGGFRLCSLGLVWVLTGPTGAGKSAWAESVAQSAPVEIVSVDSALVYRGLDIGSAKPNRELRQRIPHHLIDICEATDNYSAGRFVTDAMAAIEQIQARGKVPLLVGGTMLY